MANANVTTGEWVAIHEEERYCPDQRCTITITEETCKVCGARIRFVGPKRYISDTFCPACGSRMSNGQELLYTPRNKEN